MAVSDDEGEVGSLLAGAVSDVWLRCMERWRTRGRVNDLPRNRRVPRYIPSFDTLLGLRFAVKFRDDYPFLISKLRSHDPIEAACAFDVLVEACFCFPEHQVPTEVIDVQLPLPLWLREEIANDSAYGNFTGTTIGEFLHFELDQT